jgi:UDP-N-acetylmuramoyl-tripeptide--D-alanyl-D-alanine ligase
MAKLAPLEGRGRALAGALGLTLIDDCYNANPESVVRALELTAELATQRSLRPHCLLGAMRELGEASAAAHARVLERAHALGYATIAGAGAEMDAAMRGHSHAASFEPCGSVEGAIERLRGRFGAEDLLLVKGSRSVGLERVLAALAAPATETT